MSNQEQFGKSEMARAGTSKTEHWNETFEETVFDNISGKSSKISHRPSGLMNNDLKLCENGHDQKLTTSTSGQSLPPSSKRKNVGLNSDINLELNPVGSLQELCITRHIPFPVYTFCNENLKKHNAGITAVCSMSIYNFSVTDRTKQAAKKKAAYLMFKQVKNVTSDDFQVDDTFKRIDAARNDKFFLCDESTTLLKTFFGLISAPKTPNLQNIEKNSIKFELTAADTWKKISEKENFTYNYVVISQNNDEVEVLMQVNTTPVIVVLKSGKNENDAQESASSVVLTYLKLKLNI